jgi:hypothetical protein
MASKCRCMYVVDGKARHRDSNLRHSASFVNAIISWMAYMYVPMHVHMYVYSYVHMYVHMYAFTVENKNPFELAFTWLATLKLSNLYIHTYTYLHLHTYLWVVAHTCSCNWHSIYLNSPVNIGMYVSKHCHNLHFVKCRWGTFTKLCCSFTLKTSLHYQ